MMNKRKLAKKDTALNVSSYFLEGEIMYRSCKYCGRIVEYNHECSLKPKKKDYQRSDIKIVKFRKTSAWIHKSEEIRERDNYMCQYCLHIEKKITMDTIEVHHITPIKKNWEKRLDNYNLISLCRVHHEQAENGKIPKKLLSKIAEGNEKKNPSPIILL